MASRLARLLSSHAYSVVASVRSGEEAVTGSQWLRPDVVFLAAELDGDIDGGAAAEEISITTQSRIVFIEDEPGEVHFKPSPDTGFIRRTDDDQAVLTAADSLTERDRFSEFEASEWADEFMFA